PPVPGGFMHLDCNRFARRRRMLYLDRFARAEQIGGNAKEYRRMLPDTAGGLFVAGRVPVEPFWRSPDHVARIGLEVGGLGKVVVHRLSDRHLQTSIAREDERHTAHCMTKGG